MRKRARQRSLRRAWRMLRWPLLAHVTLALATGLACGVVTAHYPMVISPPAARRSGCEGFPSRLPRYSHLTLRSSARWSSTPRWSRCGGASPIDPESAGDDKRVATDAAFKLRTTANRRRCTLQSPERKRSQFVRQREMADRRLIAAIRATAMELPGLPHSRHSP
jgi:hypothetical protein